MVFVKRWSYCCFYCVVSFHRFTGTPLWHIIMFITSNQGEFDPSPIVYLLFSIVYCKKRVVPFAVNVHCMYCINGSM